MTLPGAHRRSCHSQAATISPPNRSPRPPRSHDGSVGTSHRFWLADLKANEAALALDPPRAGVFYSPSPSSTSSADRPRARARALASPSADLHYRAAELASITERFREPAVAPTAARRSPTPADLVAMSRLSRDIVNSLAEVARHHRRQEGRGSTITAPSRSDLEKLGGWSGFRKVRSSLFSSSHFSLSFSFPFFLLLFSFSFYFFSLAILFLFLFFFLIVFSILSFPVLSLCSLLSPTYSQTPHADS